MELRVLEYKNLVKKAGEVIRDFTQKTFKFYREDSPYNTYIVQETDEMRPDIIANKFYGDVNYVDGLLKFNGIGAWWSIKRGDVLFVPSKGYLDRCYFRPEIESKGKKSENFLIENFTDPSKKSKVDQKRLEFLKKKAESKKRGSKQIVPTTFVNSRTENVQSDGQGGLNLT